MAKNPRYVLRGFRGVVPTTEPAKITGLTGKKKVFMCRVLGFDFCKVDGAFIRAQWADFLGGQNINYRFIPKHDIWVDYTINEWLGFIASHELFEVLLMQLHKWKYERAHIAANALEQELRGISELSQLNEERLRTVWLHHLRYYFPHGQELEGTAASVARQFWKYI